MVLDSKQIQKTKKRKKQSIILIATLFCLLIITLVCKNSVPEKIGKVFEQLETQQVDQLTTNHQSKAKKTVSLNTQTAILKNLCSSSTFKWPDKEMLLKDVFADRSFETQLVSENIFYKKKGFPNRIVRKTESELILFQEDSEGFPFPVVIEDENRNTQILQFISGYYKQSVQRLIEYSNSSTSLVLNIEDAKLVEIKLNSDNLFIECEEDKCRCDES